MKKTLLGSFLLILGLVLGAGMAAAGDLPVAAPVCAAEISAPVPAPTPAPAVNDLLAPAPQPAAICPLIGCVNDEYCRRDRDCTTAPGGVCNLFCPTQGCCSYPG
jgi:hypothetical protein